MQSEINGGTETTVPTTPITEAYDPLAEENETVQAPVEASAPTEQPSQVDVQQPVINQQVAPTNRPPYKSAFMPVNDKQISDLDITQRLPNQLISDDEIETYFDLCKQQAELNKKDKDHIVALKDIMEAFQQISFNMHGTDFKSFFDRNAGNLAQYATGQKGIKIRTSYPSFNLDESHEELTGALAERYINKITRTGSTTKIPLWHSGVLLVIDPFTEQELVDLNLALGRQQIDLGLNTRGACFTGDDIHIVGTITNFILEHVVDCNVKGFDQRMLRKLILVNDNPALMAGALAAIYPAGYPVFHACVNKDAGVCNYNITAKRKENGDFYPDSLLDFTKMLVVNDINLSIEDLNLMSSASRSQTLEEVRKYQNRVRNYAVKGCERVDLWTLPTPNGDVTMTVNFKTPTIAEYEITATTWVNNVKKMTELALAAEIDLNDVSREDKRSKILNSYSAITDLVKHAGWIDYFTFTEANGIARTVSKEEVISKTLASFTQVDGFVEAFEKAVQAYKENSIIAWTGIPNFECPECHSGQTDPSSATPSLIPINMAGYFFSTMEWRKQMRQQLDL